MSDTAATSWILSTDQTLEALHAQIEKQPGSLYAVLDACDEPRVLAKVEELRPKRAVSLYRGWAESDYYDIAPYLVAVDGSVLNWLVDNLWADPWGVFVSTSVDMAALRRHLRHFLMVEDPDGRKLYFRFYDPRVLETYLQNCSPAEASQFFGPANAFGVTSDNGQKVTWIQRQNGT